MTDKDNIQALLDNLKKVINGKDEIVELILVALLGGGHVLIEDVPGVGKTTLAKALALSLSADCRRVQFTPDLLPSDIVGGMVYLPKDGTFDFRPGPIFCNILLADEINRASPRTQSALLEAMNEEQVSIEGVTRKLDPPFMVIATQNPVEYQGTYPLPEAQLDRFMMQLEMGYPEDDVELSVVLNQKISHPLEKISSVMTIDNVIRLQKDVCKVEVEKSVAKYIVAVVRETRTDHRVELGASPRGSLSLYRACQSLALMRGRNYVLPDDVKELAVPVLRHRFSLNLKAKHAGEKNASVIRELLSTIKVPV